VVGGDKVNGKVGVGGEKDGRRKMGRGVGGCEVGRNGRGGSGVR